MKAMIFAAGLGSRLGELTKNIPKTLVTINNKTLLQIIVEKLQNSGFNSIIVNVHHFADQIVSEIEKLNKAGYNIAVSDETDKLLDTGGGLYKARWFFDDKPFVLYNTDIITDLELKALLDFHINKGGIATLAVRKRPGERVFLIDAGGRIRGWCNTATGEKIIIGSKSDNLSEIAFSGIHIVNPEIFNLMDQGVYSLTSLYLKIAADQKIFTFRYDNGFWADIRTPEKLEEVRKFFQDNHW